MTAISGSNDCHCRGRASAAYLLWSKCSSRRKSRAELVRSPPPYCDPAVWSPSLGLMLATIRPHSFALWMICPGGDHTEDPSFESGTTFRRTVWTISCYGDHGVRSAHYGVESSHSYMISYIEGRAEAATGIANPLLTRGGNISLRRSRDFKTCSLVMWVDHTETLNMLCIMYLLPLGCLQHVKLRTIPCFRLGTTPKVRT